MKVILDTDKRTVTVPYNYAEKVDEINRIAREFGGATTEPMKPLEYIQRIWNECMSDTETCLVVAPKPIRGKHI